MSLEMIEKLVAQSRPTRSEKRPLAARPQPGEQIHQLSIASCPISKHDAPHNPEPRRGERIPRQRCQRFGFGNEVLGLLVHDEHETVGEAMDGPIAVENRLVESSSIGPLGTVRHEHALGLEMRERRAFLTAVCHKMGSGVLRELGAHARPFRLTGMQWQTRAGTSAARGSGNGERWWRDWESVPQALAASKVWALLKFTDMLIRERSDGPVIAYAGDRYDRPAQDR